MATTTGNIRPLWLKNATIIRINRQTMLPIVNIQ